MPTRSSTTRSALVTLAAGCAIAAAGLATATPASASPWDNHVHITGHIDCRSALNSPAWMWYETTAGERGWANVNNWTSVSRVVKGVKQVSWVKIQSYDIELWNVPKGGTKMKYSVGCTGGIADSQFKGSIPVKRPAAGTGATRHICGPGGAFRCVF